MSLITSSFVREWAREAYVNNVYSMSLCFYEAYGNIPCFYVLGFLRRKPVHL